MEKINKDKKTDIYLNSNQKCLMPRLLGQSKNTSKHHNTKVWINSSVSFSLTLSMLIYIVLRYATLMGKCAQHQGFFFFY